MPDGDGLVRLQARHLGRRAAAALERGGSGRIGAVFQSSFYLVLGGTWICVGPARLERGPLHLGCNLVEGLDWRASGLQVGQGCHAGLTAIRISRRWCIEARSAELWSPPPAPPWSRHSLARGLAILEQQVAGRLPEEGLASLLADTSGKQSSLLARARPAIVRLGHWLTTAADSGSDLGPPPLADLIGLGPGLTPSGDDFVCGILIALNALGFAGPAARLAGAALPLFRSNGNPISTAHFLAAAEGASAAPLHDALAALAAAHGAELEAMLERIDAIGHCSGWDALAGLVFAAKAAARLPDGNTSADLPRAHL